MTGHTGALNTAAAVRRWQLDDVTLTYVVDGAMSMLPAAFLPAVPADYWRAHPDEVDAAGHVAMSTGGLLVQRDGHTLLVDTGFGAVQMESPFGGVDCGAFLDTLASLGVAPDDVDVVALTHLHPDHTGWMFTADAGDPVFPRATYVLAEAEWSPLAGGAPDADKGIAAIVSGLQRHPRLRLVADGEEVVPGITALVTPGHSSGHASYVVTTARGARVVAFGDAFHAPAQLGHPDWGSAPDAEPARVPGARRRIIDELLDLDTYGFAIHFGDQPFGRVVSDGGVPRWEPVAAPVVAPPPGTNRSAT